MGAYVRKQAEYVVVGSGPGGATVARELARAGRRVILLEKGRDHRGTWYYGTHLGATLYCEKGGFLTTEEGYRIVQGAMTGGSSNLYCACAALPPAWLKERHGIDLEPYAQATVEELNIAPLPRPLWGRATQRVEEAAAELGATWIPQPKFMNVSRGEPFDCGAKCMLGCRCGAKWTANEYVDEAVRLGCELITGARVKEVLVSGGKAAGVMASLSGGNEVLRVEADTVILAAGGVQTPVILQHSGVSDAGRGMVMDTTAIVYGKGREEGMAQDPPMAVSWFDDDNGYMLSTLLDPWLMYSVNLSWKGMTHPGRLLGYGKTLGIMIKLKDDLSGGINMEGSISKPLTQRDGSRLNHASNLCRKILIQAGCSPDSVFMSPPMGTHPSGTVRIGELLSPQLETAIPNLYVSDASCFPEALDRPTVLTLISFSKRLAAHLLARAPARTEPPPRRPPEPVPAPEPKPEASPAPGPEAETAPEPEPQVKPEPVPAPKPAPKPEPKPEASPAPEPEAAPEPEPPVKPEPVPAPKPASKPEPKPEASPAPRPEAETAPKPEPPVKPAEKKKAATKKAAPKKKAAARKKAAPRKKTAARKKAKSKTAPRTQPKADTQ